MKVQNFYENLSTLHVGTMDNRCWYVPKQDGRESQILLSGDDRKPHYGNPARRFLNRQDHHL